MNHGRFLCLVMILALLFIAGCEEKVPTKEVVRPVRPFKVADVAVLTSRTFPGRAKATQEVDLAFQVAGPLVSLPVNVGDEVKKGAVRAQIDPRDFEVGLRYVQGQISRAKAAIRIDLCY